MYDAELLLESFREIVAYAKMVGLEVRFCINGGIRNVIPFILGVSVHQGWCCTEVNYDDLGCITAATDRKSVV